MSKSFQATCTSCGSVRKVRRVELLRAARPRCLRCGSAIELSQAAKDDLARIQAQKEDKDSQSRKKKEVTPEPVRIIPAREMDRFEWARYPDLWSWGKRVFNGLPFPCGPTEFYSDVAKMPWSIQNAIQSRGMELVYLAEGAFYAAGKTYFKVWPNIAEALCHTEMRIPCKNLRLPVGCFEMCFPYGQSPCFPFESALVTMIPVASGKRKLVVITMTNQKEFQTKWDGGNYGGGSILLDDDVLLEDRLAEWLDVVGEHREAARRLIRVAVGVTFFGQDRHEMVLPDLPRRVIERYQRERRQPNAVEAAREIQEARQQGMTGFKIGSEIELPRALRRQEGESGDEARERIGRELTAGHIRRGHLRLQPCGPKHQDRQLTFIEPTVVRPDLPLQTTHGYRVRPPDDWTPKLE